MSARRQPHGDATDDRILDIAERLVQTRGFNGFSYADIAAEVGITKASLHYHFATKAQLGRTLVTRYSGAFATALGRIRASGKDARRQLRDYVRLYTDVLEQQRMCLCGMVAAEYATLPPPMQVALRAFFELNEAWVAQLLEQGANEGTLTRTAPAADAARMLVGALEGEMLVARAWGDAGRFAVAAELLVRQLEPATAPGVAGRAGHPQRQRSVGRGGARRVR